jgi:hypothetical protein
MADPGVTVWPASARQGRGWGGGGPKYSVSIYKYIYYKITKFLLQDKQSGGEKEPKQKQ